MAKSEQEKIADLEAWWAECHKSDLQYAEDVLRAFEAAVPPQPVPRWVWFFIVGTGIFAAIHIACLIDFYRNDLKGSAAPVSHLEPRAYRTLHVTPEQFNNLKQSDLQPGDMIKLAPGTYEPTWTSGNWSASSAGSLSAENVLPVGEGIAIEFPEYYLVDINECWIKPPGEEKIYIKMNDYYVASDDEYQYLVINGPEGGCFADSINLKTGEVIVAK